MVDMQLYGGCPLYRDYVEQEEKQTEKELSHEPGPLSALGQIRFLGITKPDSSPNKNLDLIHAFFLDEKACSCIQCD